MSKIEEAVREYLSIYYATCKLMQAKCNREQHSMLESMLFQGMKYELKRRFKVEEDEINRLLLVIDNGTF